MYISTEVDIDAQGNVLWEKFPVVSVVVPVYNEQDSVVPLWHEIRAAIEPPSYGVAYAGDEFVVVLPGHGQDDARQKAVEIQSRIKATAYLSSQGEAVRLQASCGIASFPADADDSEGLLAAADAALFAVKRSGKGTFFNYADIVR